MRNLGPVSRRWLVEIGVMTLNDLKQVGAISAYSHIRSRHPAVTKNLLWAPLGAEHDTDWRELSDEVKKNALKHLP